MENELKKVAIVGARGYAGLELTRILLKHPDAQIEACFANEADFSLFDYLPEVQAASVPVFPMARFDEIAARVNTVFLATPPEASTDLAPRAMKAGADVIDLSGAFRLNVGEVQAEYGLVPWVGPALARGTSKAPKLVSNPGCYATAILMGLLPLLKKNLIDVATLVIDAKSGATGAGRKAAENLLFCEVEGECLPYKIGKHQHLPEIKEMAQRFASSEIDPMFVTHLLPVRRGILAGIYARVPQGVTLEKIEEAYGEAYSGYPLAKTGVVDEKKRQLLTLKRVVGSARTEIRFQLQGNQLYVFSFIDNLMKGAASQAVENFNRLYDFPLTTVLKDLEGVL